MRAPPARRPIWLSPAPALASTPTGSSPGGRRSPGGHVISLAGKGARLAAIIAQVPHVSGPAAVRSVGLVPSLRVGLRGVRDQLRAWTGRQPLYVDSVGAPGEVAAMTSPDARPGTNRLITDSRLSADEQRMDVAARIVLKIGLYSPKRWAANVTCPALVQIVESDAITPQDVAEAAAARMPRATVCTYPGGHFDPYVEPLFTDVSADQLAFLQAHVPATVTPRAQDDPAVTAE